MALAAALTSGIGATAKAEDIKTYIPSPEIKQAQKEFADARFGIFLHWGIYSMMGQGEWYLNYGPNAQEYAKAASGFYPSKFNAHDWVKAIK
ncbi:MAG: alpha-L-fucosidase, partial [Muribaculaceae bacterium]|nr:alpha-L-fucosidase [Muribaculaceae bacterium]